ncbi:hypothetical protein CQW23_03739 [Capsicum baccatum]|uniref:RsdA/BaiN/AoA(So)-like Rossmann fold-like domain-containing protein n=1 Tax=Capsicum baccatum TaxID=33114 RepID=A0A2G2XCN6_CAPBA|nr:hypothetical protein CQW23_03739 [Capsicum baccatum]
MYSLRNSRILKADGTGNIPKSKSKITVGRHPEENTTAYSGTLCVDFTPDLHIEDLKSALTRHKGQFLRQKVLNSYPSELAVVRRFWKYILDREGICGDMLWSSISNNLLNSVASLLKDCGFSVKGKGQFKDEFVTAGGIPLSEIYLDTMGSRIHPRLYFAGEVLNVDGITGGFNFQVMWLDLNP